MIHRFVGDLQQTLIMLPIHSILLARESVVAQDGLSECCSIQVFIKKGQIHSFDLCIPQLDANLSQQTRTIIQHFYAIIASHSINFTSHLKGNSQPAPKEFN